MGIPRFAEMMAEQSTTAPVLPGKASPGGLPVKVAVDARMIEHSGIGTYLRNVVAGLADHPGLEFTFLGDRSKLSRHPWFRPDRHVALDSGIYSPREQAELALKIPACDVFWSPHFNVPLLPIRARHRLVTIHDAYHLAYARTYGLARRTYGTLLYRAAAALSREIITVSEFSRSELEARLGIRPGRVKVIPNGVARGFGGGFAFRKLDLEYVLFVGNMKPHKNLRNAILAYRSILPSFPGLKFLIVGKNEGLLTPDRELGEALRGAPEGSVVFTGEVTLEELKNYYANARLFVYPSLYEGFGLPILEAMSHGLPIAASNRGPIPEVGGDLVEYFDPGNVADMAAKLAKALGAPRAGLKERYRERLESHTWERSAARHAEIMRSMAEAGKR